MENFYEYLKTQFNDLNSCKEWYRRWSREWKQEIPGHPEFPLFSLRAMAAHCSNVLEGKITDESGDQFCTEYINTKYGPDIYFWC